MSNQKHLNEGYQPGQKLNKGSFGYQPERIERGYQPQPIQQTDVLKPPSGGSNVKPSGSSEK